MLNWRDPTKTSGGFVQPGVTFIPTAPPPPGTNYNRFSSTELRKMVAMRLHIRDGEILPFLFIECHRRDDKVFVFVVPNKGHPVILEDDFPLFPSDGLISQIIMLKEVK